MFVSSVIRALAYPCWILCRNPRCPYCPGLLLKTGQTFVACVLFPALLRSEHLVASLTHTTQLVYRVEQGTSRKEDPCNVAAMTIEYKCEQKEILFSLQGMGLQCRQIKLSHGHLHTGQLSRHFVFRQVDIMGAVCWDPNYTPGLDFLDHNFLSSKNSG